MANQVLNMWKANLSTWHKNGTSKSELKAMTARARKSLELTKGENFLLILYIESL